MGTYVLAGTRQRPVADRNRTLARSGCQGLVHSFLPLALATETAYAAIPSADRIAASSLSTTTGGFAYGVEVTPAGVSFLAISCGSLE